MGSGRMSEMRDEKMKREDTLEMRVKKDAVFFYLPHWNKLDQHHDEPPESMYLPECIAVYLVSCILVW
jgi:hypothetical protein